MWVADIYGHGYTFWGREYSTKRPSGAGSLPTRRRRHERASTQEEAVDARENEREGAREVNNN